MNLSLLIDQGEDAQGQRWQQGSEKFDNLDAVLNKVTEQTLVILGAPGSGKSTLLRHYELDNSRSELKGLESSPSNSSRLTFFIQLSDYKPTHSDDTLPLPRKWLNQRWSNSNPNLPNLDELLAQGCMTLLLDALNEIPATGKEVIRLWKDFLSDLSQGPGGNRVIFSCRSLDYSASLSSKERPVPQVRIEPLDDHQVAQFIAHYAEENATQLWANLKDTDHLDLFRSPYYLKMLVEQSRDGEVPEGRTGLFSGFIRQLIKREVNGDNPLFQPGTLLTERDTQRLINAKRWKSTHELPQRGLLIPQLSQLAYRMQKQRSATEGGQVRIDYDEALDLLDQDRGEDIINAAVSIDVLIHDLEGDEITYVHQLMQEFFAARQLAHLPDPSLVQQEWRWNRVPEPLKKTLATLPDSDPLPPLLGTGWEETTVLAAAMVDDPETILQALMPTNLALAGRCAAQPEIQLSDEFKDQIAQALVERSQAPEADLRARIAAGLSLGPLGDPRFVRGQGPDGEYLLPPMVKIPGGTYTIGSDEGLYERESPQHEVALETFEIGQYSVTNAEWRLFIDADGYDDKRCWQTGEAEASRSGKATTKGPKQQWRENRKYLQENFDSIRHAVDQNKITTKQADEWEQIAQMSDPEFTDLLNDWCPPGRQIQPAFWNDEAFSNPNQPVVGICWHEAQAYCAWLSMQTDRSFRLSTEAEWEAAGRGGKVRRYAYGDEFDATHINTFETHIRRTTPIGVFPGGETPEGLTDMSGNVWNWTSSLLHDYPYQIDDGREKAVSGDDRRVLRGGSWSSNRGRARAAYRSSNRPDDRNDVIGFRLCCLSPIVD